MIRVTTGSRLHFGLFQLPSHEAESLSTWRGGPTLHVRPFGGVGLMVEAPGVELRVSRAATWSAEGPLAERSITFARRIAEFISELTCHCHIAIARAAPEHAGLGTGTQLGLAVVSALAQVAGLTGLDTPALAAHIGRGERSGLGTYGFRHGGFLVEGVAHAESTSGAVGTLPEALRGLSACRTARLDFPVNWRVVLVLPPGERGLHGAGEQLAFARLNPPSTSWTDSLRRLVRFRMLPALVEENLDSFGEAVHEFNARVGESFAAVQGGTYASPDIAQIVHFVRDQGVRGVGQSSWGPTVFAIVADQGRGEDLARRLRSRFSLQDNEVMVTRARNRGARVSRE